MRWPCCTLSVLHVGRAARPTCAGHKQRGLTCEARFAFGNWRLAILGQIQSDGFLRQLSAYMPASATLFPHWLQMHFEGILRAHTNIVRTQRGSYPRAREHAQPCAQQPCQRSVPGAAQERGWGRQPLPLLHYELSRPSFALAAKVEGIFVSTNPIPWP
jgi:hypothetical protein